MPRLRVPKIGRRRSAPGLPGARIVVGLGNPGPKWERNRHNAGFRVVDELSRRLGVAVSRRERLVFRGEAVTEYGPLALAKPRTFMNDSGRAVQALLTLYRAKPAELIVIVDELDLEPGRIRVRSGGSDAGQRGMRSIRDAIGSLDFPRIRVGVGRPYVDGRASHHPDVVADHQLSNPDPEEAALISEAEARAADAVIAILRDGVESAMNEFNAKAGKETPGAGTPSDTEPQ